MAKEESKMKIRYPMVAGQFYEKDPYTLRKEVQSYIDNAEFYPDLEPIALIAPHAGYIFSGAVAGYSYRQVKGRKYDAVIVISPSHTDYFAFSSVMADGVYRTPLGDVPIESELAERIAANSDFVVISERGHMPPAHGGRGEHALEVQLPFLQIALGDFKLVPIVTGGQRWELCRELGEAIASAADGKKVLIVASSDLSHFYRYDEANRLDSAFIEILQTLEPRRICEALQSKEVEACGGGPIAAAMIAAQKLGAGGIKILKHANSGDVPIAGKDSVVGYLAAVMHRNPDQRKEVDNMEEESAEQTPFKPLTLAEKRQLMEIAKRTVEAVVKGAAVPKFQPLTETLKEERGAFVTLKKKGQLRGCIGYIIPVKPLYLTVQEVAESAAMKDPRFPPVTKAELPDLEYEISALTPVREIKNIEEIEVGRDGIIIRRGYRQGLLLPQVAEEYNWNRMQFLEHTCMKAGLPVDAWKDSDTEISVFSAEVFGEEDVK